MYEEIRMAKLLKQKLLEVTRNAKIEAFQKNEWVSEKLRAENLSSEINFRCQSLNTKYDQELRYLSDHQILEINQNKNLDIEFNGIVEKVANLAALVSTGGEAVREMLADAASKRDVVADKKQNFKKVYIT